MLTSKDDDGSLATAAVVPPTVKTTGEVFIERDYTEGSAVKFSTIMPQELENKLEQSVLEHTVNRLNKYFAKAEKSSWTSYLTGCFLFCFCLPTRNEKCLRKVRKFIAEQNETVYLPRGLLLTDPAERGLRVVQITILDQNSDGNKSGGLEASSPPGGDPTSPLLNDVIIDIPATEADTHNKINGKTDNEFGGLGPSSPPGCDPTAPLLNGVIDNSTSDADIHTKTNVMNDNEFGGLGPSSPPGCDPTAPSLNDVVIDIPTTEADTHTKTNGMNDNEFGGLGPSSPPGCDPTATSLNSLMIDIPTSDADTHTKTNGKNDNEFGNLGLSSPTECDPTAPSLNDEVDIPTTDDNTDTKKNGKSDNRPYLETHL